ncbi:MAG: hypothetical protein ABIK89_03110 [Planctomycetota bacterium]
MSRLFENTVCVTVTFHRPGAVRAFRAGEVEVVKSGDREDFQKADQSQVGANRKIFQNGYYKQAGDVAKRFYDWLDKRALDVPLGNSVRVIPRDTLPEAKEEFERAKREYEDCADSFCEPAEYLKTKMAARDRLRELFDEKVYPTRDTLRGRFSVDWWELEFGADSAAALNEAEQDVIQALRETFAGLVSHLAAKLSPLEDGKRRRLHPSAVANLKEFLDLFDQRNILGDDELAGMVGKARNLVSGERVYDSLKDNDTLREFVGEQLGEIRANLDTLITDGPRRVVTFGEEDA